MKTTATAATFAYVERVLRYLASLRYFFDRVERLLAFVSRAEKEKVQITFWYWKWCSKKIYFCTHWKVLLLVAELPQCLPPLSSEHPVTPCWCCPSFAWLCCQCMPSCFSGCMCLKQQCYICRSIWPFWNTQHYDYQSYRTQWKSMALSQMVPFSHTGQRILCGGLPGMQKPSFWEMKLHWEAGSRHLVQSYS